MPVIGTRQSPIAITTNDALQLAKPDDLFRIEYKDQKYHGVFVGVHPSHGNFQLDKPPYPVVRFRSDKYELRRIHIHFKSEHVIDTAGQRDYEVHLVHARQGMTLADPKLVIGILYHESAKATTGGGLEAFNELLREKAKTGPLLRPFKVGEVLHEAKIKPLDFFPRLQDGKTPDLTNWFHYEGSLTSEPYSEDVSWFVMKTESKIDPKKLEDLEQYAEQEARPTYALDRRLVVRSFGS